MAKHVKDSIEFKRFFKNLEKLTDGKTLGKIIGKSPEWKAMIGVIIGQAKAGHGPQGQAYPAYSEQYAKVKQRTGGILGRWLRGKDKTGRTGGMLDERNFSPEVDQSGRLFVVWTPADSKQAIYGQVHNDGVGKMPKRTWMHLNSPAHAKAVLKVFQAAYKTLVVSINAGKTL